MIDFRNKIKQLIKQVFVINDNKKDDSEYPTNEIEYSNKTSVVNRLQMYGYNYNPPKGTWGLCYSAQGRESTKFVMFSEMDKRKKGLKPGEIYIQHPITGSSIYLKEDGSIDIKGKDVTISADEQIKFVTPSLLHGDTNIGNTHKHGPGTYAADGKAVAGCSDPPDTC